MGRKKKSENSDEDTANFIEISIDPCLFSNFSNEDSMANYFYSQTISDDFVKLKTELISEIISVIDANLTDKQKEVVKMTYFDGKTQNEISTHLGKHQTTIHKILQGNIDYSNEKRRYGGAIKKLKRLCMENEKIRSILAKMRSSIYKKLDEDY